MQQFFIRAQGQDPTRYLEQAVMEDLREEYGELLPERTTVLSWLVYDMSPDLSTYILERTACQKPLLPGFR